MTLEQIREQGLAVLRKHLGIVGTEPTAYSSPD
jgi:hypothetical protein